MADLDPVGVDGPPARGQQLDIVIGTGRDRHVSRGLDQGRVLLIRGEHPSRVRGVTQPVVRPVLPAGDQPLIQQFLQLQHRPQRLAVDAAAAPVRIRPQIARHELAEQLPQRREHPEEPTPTEIVDEQRAQRVEEHVAGEAQCHEQPHRGRPPIRPELPVHDEHSRGEHQGAEETGRALHQQQETE